MLDPGMWTNQLTATKTHASFRSEPAQDPPAQISVLPWNSENESQECAVEPLRMEKSNQTGNNGKLQQRRASSACTRTRTHTRPRAHGVLGARGSGMRSKQANRYPKPGE